MKATIISFLLKLFTSEATKTLIAVGINKLLDSKKDGVTSDIAEVMIDGIARSKANPTKEDVFKEALKELSK